MSLELSRDAWRAIREVHLSLTVIERAVLLDLADRSNRHSGQCNPSVQTISKDCGTSESSVKRAIATLEGLGLLHVDRTVGGDRRMSNSYRLTLSTVNPVHGEPGSQEPATGSTVSATGSTVTPKPGTNQFEPASCPTCNGERIINVDPRGHGTFANCPDCTPSRRQHRTSTRAGAR